MELIAKERLALRELKKWSNIEEQIWQQKARVDWLQLGDSNTKFFHAYAKMRQNSNAIHRLTRLDGTSCVGQKLIKKEVEEFYKKLMGTASEELTMVDKMIMRRGPSLNHQQQLMLQAECSDTEVKEALFGMDSNKAPGIDGYNVYFLKKSWHIIGEEIIQAVVHFFLILEYCLRILI